MEQQPNNQVAEWLLDGIACQQCGDLEVDFSANNLVDSDEGVGNGPLNDEGLCTNCVEANGIKSEIISAESAAHDYQTKMVKASAINGTHVLVGECGGLSAVFTAEPYEELGKYTIILTEHGYLYINNEKSLEVLEDSP